MGRKRMSERGLKKHVGEELKLGERRRGWKRRGWKIEGVNSQGTCLKQ